MAGFHLSSAPIQPERLKEAMRHRRAGALVSFEGWVRDHNEGRPVEKLEYEAFEALALGEGEKIITEALVKFDILEAECVHRTGLLAIGEPAVWVGVVAAHRDAAYQASRYIIDHIKTRLPIWKKEYYADGPAEWVNCRQCAHHGHAVAGAVKIGQQFPPKTAVASDNNSQDREGHRMPSPPSAQDASQRYARQLMLPEVGVSGQQKLAQAKVLVVGAGGLGTAALQYLATAGVGHLGICEPDRLEASNLNRQVLYRMDGLGQAKARLAASRLRAMNPDIRLYLHEERLTKANVAQTLSPYDLILDCTDNFPTKFLINDVAVMLRKPLIQASIHQYEGQVHLYRPTASGCLRCLWPEAPRNGVLGGCEETGVLGPVPGVFGTLQALEALKFLLGLPTPLQDHLLIMDLLTLEMRKLRREKRPECQHGEDYLLHPPQEAPAPAAKPSPSPVEVAAVTAVRDNVVAFRKRDENPVVEAMLETSRQDDLEGVWERRYDDDHSIPGQTAAMQASVEDWELEMMPWSRQALAEFTLLDIREAHERGQVKGNPLEPLDYELLPYSRFDAARLDRDRKYLLLCQRGQYSAHLAAELRQQGFQNVYSLAGGVQRHNFSYLRDVLSVQEALHYGGH